MDTQNWFKPMKRYISCALCGAIFLAEVGHKHEWGRLDPHLPHQEFPAANQGNLGIVLATTTSLGTAWGT